MERTIDEKNEKLNVVEKKRKETDLITAKEIRKSEVITETTDSKKNNVQQENNVMENKTIDKKVNDQPSDSSNNEKENTSGDKPTLDVLIDAFTSLNFLIVSAREIAPPSREDLLKSLLRNDEIILREINKIETRYTVWNDEPNKNFYIFRNSESSIKFDALSEMFEKFMQLLSDRKHQSEVFIREPERVFLASKRVYEPQLLGFPVDQIITSSISSDFVRAILENYCGGSLFTTGVVESYAIGDKAVLETSARLVRFSLNRMTQEREAREKIVNVVRLLRGQEIASLNSRNAHQFYYPTYPFNLVQGVFDDFITSTSLRISFMELIVMPIVRYTPVPSTTLIKSAGASLYRAAFIGDICNRSWKPEMSDLLFSYILSLLLPGEILFDIDFRDPTVSVEVRGFAAVLARLMFLFSENGIFTNTTIATQISIDQAIIDWGSTTNALARNGETGSIFPLNDYTLTRPTSHERMCFEYLKIQRGNGGACGNGHLFIKINESMRQFYPTISPRANYVADTADYKDFRNGKVFLSEWKVYQGACSFLRKISGGNNYASLFIVFAQRMFEFFIRLNEYSQVAWYTIFRMKESSSDQMDLDGLQLSSSRVQLSVDFILTVSKGLDNSFFKEKLDIIERTRLESAFIRESAYISLRWKYLEALFERVGRLDSFPRRRRIEIACSTSKIYEYIRSIMYSSDEDQKILDVLKLFPTTDELTMCYIPLLDLSNEVLLFFGVLPVVNVQCSLNYINERVMKECIDASRPLGNRTTLENVPSYTYRSIESFIRNKTFNSVFFESVRKPFKLKILIPFSICHSLNDFENIKCLVKQSVITSDVSYEHHVRNSEVKILLMKLDPQHFVFDDDYIISPYQVCAASPDANFYDRIISDFRTFYTALNERVTRVLMLTKADFYFISLYGPITCGGVKSEQT